MKKGEILKCGDAVLPAPVSVSVSDELIWTSDTGRTLSGYMIGDVVAAKKTVSIKWELLREEELKVIRDQLTGGFFPITFHDDGMDVTIEAYRGTISKEHLGDIGDGSYWYRSVSADIIQR